MTPYYEQSGVTIYHGDCREILPTLDGSLVMVTDPPYPNNAGHLVRHIEAAREVLYGYRGYIALVFWTELEPPPIYRLPLVAVHIWHRTNVNGRPYEPIYHYAAVGAKKRSVVIETAAVFDGVGPGCSEYAGHPTQKSEGVMRQLLLMTPGGATTLDPFMGSGTTLVAAKRLGRRAIGIELEEKYCEITARRLQQESLFTEGIA
jgi:DNA modification methylase